MKLLEIMLNHRLQLWFILDRLWRINFNKFNF